MVLPDYYTDQDLDVLDAIRAWEHEQLASTTRKAAMRMQVGVVPELSPKKLRRATKSEARKELEEEFKPALAPKKWQVETYKIVLVELNKIAQDQYFQPTHESLQLRAYHRWRKHFIEAGEIPYYPPCSTLNIYDYFPMSERDPYRLVMIFNVAELLPENRRDPELEMRLKKIGFPYRYERKLVDADREETIRLVREAQARNEARVAQENAEWEARQKEHELRIAEEQKKQAELERQQKLEREQEAEQKRLQEEAERRRILQEELKREAKERQARIDAEKQRAEMEREQELKRKQEAERKRQEEATRQAEQQRRRSKQAHQAAAEEDWQFEVIGDKINATIQRFVRNLLKILF